MHFNSELKLSTGENIYSSYELEVAQAGFMEVGNLLFLQSIITAVNSSIIWKLNILEGEGVSHSCSTFFS